MMAVRSLWTAARPPLFAYRKRFLTIKLCTINDKLLSTRLFSGIRKAAAAPQSKGFVQLENCHFTKLFV
jgi:hypothetical protein